MAERAMERHNQSSSNIFRCLPDMSKRFGDNPLKLIMVPPWDRDDCPAGGGWHTAGREKLHQHTEPMREAAVLLAATTKGESE
jgi:hypothetical protein